MSPGKPVLRLLVCGFTIGATSLGWCSDRATDRLEALGRALESAAVWQASYDQEFVPSGMTMGEQATGRVWLAWPDQALFHTGDPPTRLMGLEGRVARLVDHEADTCDQHHLSDPEWERVPLAAVLDPRGAAEHFTVLENGDRGISLVPRQAGGVDRVEIFLDDGNLPVEVDIWDPQGAVNRFRFAGWKTANQPPSGAWLPAAPVGVECVTDPGALD